MYQLDRKRREKVLIKFLIGTRFPIDKLLADEKKHTRKLYTGLIVSFTW